MTTTNYADIPAPADATELTKHQPAQNRERSSEICSPPKSRQRPSGAILAAIPLLGWQRR